MSIFDFKFSIGTGDFGNTAINMFVEGNDISENRLAYWININAPLTVEFRVSKNTDEGQNIKRLIDEVNEKSIPHYVLHQYLMQLVFDNLLTNELLKAINSAIDNAREAGKKDAKAELRAWLKS